MRSDDEVKLCQTTNNLSLARATLAVCDEHRDELLATAMASDRDTAALQFSAGARRRVQVVGLARGLSRDPRDKRLAMEVEDHPLDYGDFEGTIPAGGYGGGTVQLWDRGFWSAEGMSPDDILAAGGLKFTLEGECLYGSWVLIRMKRDWASGKRPSRHANWLLIKHRDDHAREGDDDALLGDDRSVASGGPIAKIAGGKGRAPKPFMVAGTAKPLANNAGWDTSVGIAADQRRANRA